MPKLSELLSGGSAEEPSEKTLRKNALNRIAPDYAMLFFDHLYSEYLALKASITEEFSRRYFSCCSPRDYWRDLLSPKSTRPGGNGVRKLRQRHPPLHDPRHRRHHLLRHQRPPGAPPLRHPLHRPLRPLRPTKRPTPNLQIHPKPRALQPINLRVNHSGRLHRHLHRHPRLTQ